MDTIFCCSSVQPYRPAVLAHEAKFRSFLSWTESSKNPSIDLELNATQFLTDNSPTCFVIQVVRQVNYGPLEWKKYFANSDGFDASFKQVTEGDLIAANYLKLNSYKNFRCTQHNLFFELNIYQKDPVNKHHWRANIARPATEIDLQSTTGNSTVAARTTAPSTFPFRIDSANDSNLELATPGVETSVGSGLTSHLRPMAPTAVDSVEDSKSNQGVTHGPEKEHLEGDETRESMDSLMATNLTTQRRHTEDMDF